jgi:hypothetical protein
MLPASSLSRAAYGLRVLLMTQIDEFDDIDRIRIGHPADTIKDLEDSDQNCLNLFFYDVNYDGYPADGTSQNPFYVRLHCLITAVGHKSQEPENNGGNNQRDVSKGENELRLIGEVMRILHEQPLLSVDDDNQNEIALLQVVPHAMNLDSLNHIWSTQGDTSYRLSVAYEMALAPVPHVLPAEPSPLVGDSQMVAWGRMSRPSDQEKDGAISLKPEVAYLEIDTGAEDWTPHICFVEQADPTNKTLHYVFKVEGSLDQTLNILVAGRDNGKVKLFWNVWRRKTDNRIVAWKEDIPDSVLPAEKEIKDDPAATPPFFPNRIDPADIDSRRIVLAKLPDDVRAGDTRTWQATLHAVHEWEHEVPAGSGVIKTTPVKSNSILFYGELP